MILICGIPNSGKTTYSENYENVIHFDEVLGRHRRDHIVEIVSKDNSTVVEGVYGSVKERLPLIQASKSKNTCIWLDTSLDKCIERETHGRKRSEHIVIWAAEDFEPPTYEEGWDEITIIRDNG